MMAGILNSRLGWRKSRAGRKYHLFQDEKKPLCGKTMRNVFFAEEVIQSDEIVCKKCLYSLKLQEEKV